MTTATTPAAASGIKAERIALPSNQGPIIFESLLHINNANSVNEFATQYSALVNQFQRLQGIAQRRDQALTTAEKDALHKVLEAEVRDFDAKDSLFQKVYGFRVGAIATRPVYLSKTARLLLTVTDEELTKARAEKEFKEESLVTVDGKKQLVASTMSGTALDEFLRNAETINQQRNGLIQHKTAVDAATGDDKKTLEESFKKAEAELIKNNEIMAKTYGFSITRNFVLDVLSAKFFVALNQEEVQKAVSAQQAAASPSSTTEALAAKKAKN